MLDDLFTENEGEDTKAADFDGRSTAEILAAAGFNELQNNSGVNGLEQVLRDLGHELKNADNLKVSVVQGEAVKRLEKLGVKRPARLVDEALRAVRPSKDKKDSLGVGSSIAFEKLERYPEFVVGAVLLDEIVSVFLCYVSMLREAADALSLWVLFTYVYDVFDVAPRIQVKSPTRRCGKSRLLAVLRALAHRALLASNVTPATLFRCIAQFSPSLLIDEADSFVRGNEELRGILNSGHSKGTAFVLRTVGEEYEPRLFSTWAPMAIAGIGNLPPTVEDRSITIPMKRKIPGERVERLRDGKLFGECATRRRKCLRWAEDNLDTLRASDPGELPEGLDDRAMDNWMPLFAIADAVGGDWPSRARKAARLLSAGRDEEDDGYGTQVLADLQALFQKRAVDRISTEEVLAALHGLQERPWAEYGRRKKPMTPRQLAGLLKPFGVRSKTIRLSDATTPKGYLLEDLKEPFSRYLPGSQSATTPHTSGDEAYDRTHPQQGLSCGGYDGDASAD